VLIERSNGTLARRLDFSGSTTQSIDSTASRSSRRIGFQPNTRWYLEFGGRVDRDGVIRQFNVTPRVGTAVLLNASGSAVLRGGFGLFYERTPSTAGAFDQFEGAVDRRFGERRLSRRSVARSVPAHHGRSRDAAQRTWDIGYDHRLNSRWSFHLSAVDRRGTHELVLDPLQTGATGELRLSASGRSSYRGAEVGVHFTHGPGADLNVTYARSFARADLNAFTSYYDTILWPVVGANAYAPPAPTRRTASWRGTPDADAAVAAAGHLRLAQRPAICGRR